MSRELATELVAEVSDLAEEAFSKVLHILALYRKYTGALTFENFVTGATYCVLCRGPNAHKGE